MEDKYLDKRIARMEKQKKQLIELDKSDCDEMTKFEEFKKIINQDQEEFSQRQVVERYFYLHISLIQERLTKKASFFLVKDKTIKKIQDGCAFLNWLIAEGFTPSRKIKKPIYQDTLGAMIDYIYVHKKKKIIVFTIPDSEELPNVCSLAITVEEFKKEYSENWDSGDK